MIRFRYSLKNGPESVGPFPEKLDTGRKREFAAKDSFNVLLSDHHLRRIRILGVELRIKTSRPIQG
jgi:hypothetical protein